VKTAIAIGNFDAVHRGHIALVQKAREVVGASGKVKIWSFDPPPVSILDPTIKLDRLTTFEKRTSLLLDAGVDHVRQIVPTKELLEQSPEAFIAEVVAKSSPNVIVEGEGFEFGKNREGDAALLHTLGNQFDFTFEEVPPVMVTLSDNSNVRASSSLVRSLLHDGNVEDATIVLGRAVQLTGRVVKGDQRGRLIGIPTANLAEVATMLPKDGIYAGSAMVDTEQYIAAISIGTKPTFGENKRGTEVHLIGFDGDLHHYGWQLSVTISHWMREQEAFDSTDALRMQIEADLKAITKLTESMQ
jgi:riboflavin kinase/FMN adenylyltransferase